MRLHEFEIDLVAHMVRDHTDEILNERAENSIIMGMNNLVILKGTDNATKFLAQVINAYTAHTEHGDLLHSAYNGYRELEGMAL